MCGAGLAYLFMLMPTAWESTAWCSHTAILVFTVDITVETVGCAIVIYRLHKLWNCKTNMTRALLINFIICKTIIITFAGVVIAELSEKLIFIQFENVRVCFTSVALRLDLGVWITALLFDILAFTLLFVNAMARPRLESQRLLKLLYQDGMVFFLTTFSMRIFNLVMSSLNSPSLFYLGFIFSGATLTMATSRVFLNLFSIDTPVEMESPETNSIDYTNSDDGRSYVSY